MAGTILSVDIGTSSLKAAFIDTEGRLYAFERSTYKKKPNGAVDAEAWEDAFKRTLLSLHSQAPDCVPDGICISGNGPTLVPVTGEGEALAPIYWHSGIVTVPSRDGAAHEAKSLFLPHVAWFKENFPSEYKRVNLFLSSHEWLAYRLGASALSILPNKLYEPFYWDELQCNLFGLDIKKFPPFVKSGSIMGHLSKEAASQLAPVSLNCLKSGIPIIAGGPDFITALIGTGALKPGLVCDRAGSSEGINVCTLASEKTSQAQGVRVLPHVREGFLNVGKIIPLSGRLFEWYRVKAGQENKGYKELLSELIPSTSDPDIFNVHHFFPFIAPNADISMDFLNSPPGLPEQEDTIAFGRVVLCSMGFAVRSAAEHLAGQGFPVHEMRVSGGQCKNESWNQLKADISGVTLLIPEIHDGELAGNAALAATALKSPHQGGDMAEAELSTTVEKMIRFKEVYKPSSANASYWAEHYRLYKEQLTPVQKPSIGGGA